MKCGAIRAAWKTKHIAFVLAMTTLGVLLKRQTVKSSTVKGAKRPYLKVRQETEPNRECMTCG